MTSESERLQILELINSGQISVEDGLRLLSAIDEAEEKLPPPGGYEFSAPEPPSVEPVILDATPQLPEDPLPPPAYPKNSPLPAAPDIVVSGSGSGSSEGSSTADEFIPPRETALPSDVERWKRWWLIPLFIGVGFTVLGALLMLFAWQASQFSFWFACSWLPLFIGIAVIGLAVASSRMRWLHLRVTQPEGERPRNISISMPLPVRLISWIVRVVGMRSPSLRERDLDQMILAMDDLSPNEPLHIEVDEDNGAHVEIFIG